MANQLLNSLISGNRDMSTLMQKNVNVASSVTRNWSFNLTDTYEEEISDKFQSDQTELCLDGTWPMTSWSVQYDILGKLCQHWNKKITRYKWPSSEVSNDLQFDCTKTGKNVYFTFKNSLLTSWFLLSRWRCSTSLSNLFCSWEISLSCFSNWLLRSWRVSVSERSREA